MGSQLRWLERTPDKREVDGSIPFEPTTISSSKYKVQNLKESTLKNIQMKNKVKLYLIKQLSKSEDIWLEITYAKFERK